VLWGTEIKRIIGAVRITGHNRKESRIPEIRGRRGLSVLGSGLPLVDRSVWLITDAVEEWSRRGIEGGSLW
jgi:hypothetical protein